jgi:hypothetical protein
MAAEVALKWAARNGVAFDHAKTEAALFRKERKRNKTPPTTTIKVGNLDVPFHKEAWDLAGLAANPQRAPCD